jgi:photosystem II stability/assembly factor-like uncharacterized protein
MRVAVNNYLGGNFLSRHGGYPWLSASEGYTGALVRGVAVSPIRASTVFAASRSGVFRSEDGGGHWVGTQYPPPELFRPGAPIKLTEIAAVAVDPLRPSRVLASSLETGGLLVSEDEGRSWRLASFPIGSAAPVSLAFAAGDWEVVYSGSGPFRCKEEGGVSPAECNVAGSGVFISEDGGETWVRPGGSDLDDKAVLTVEAHPSDPNTVVAGTHSLGLYRSRDRGASWSQTGAGLPALPVLDLAIHPLEPGLVFAGLQGGAVYKSVDGGETFVQSSAGLDPNAFVFSVVVDPNDTQVAYLADRFGGVHVSTDAGATWQAMNDGLEHLAARALALSAEGSVLYVGVEGAGVWRLGEPGEQPPPHDTCDRAVEIAMGTYSEQFSHAGPDGAASCVSPPGEDLWYRYSAPATGTLHVNTCGTHDVAGIDVGIDTVVSLHAACPGRPDNELLGGCNDSSREGSDPMACALFDTHVPGDGAVAVPVQAGEEVWIRVGQRIPGAHGEFWLTVGMSLFADGFESGDSSAWSDAIGWYAGYLEVHTGAAHRGTYGLEIAVGGACSAPGDLVITSPPVIEGLYLGCRSITASGVEAGGLGATFATGDWIGLGDAFSVDPGSPFVAALDPGFVSGLAYVQDDTPETLDRYRARFELRADDLAMAGGDWVELFNGYSANGDVQFKVILRYSTILSAKQLLLVVRQDDGTFVVAPAAEGVLVPDGWNEIEIGWETGPGTGSLSVSVNGEAELRLTDIDNDSQRLDEVRLGNIGGSVTTTLGSLDLDEFASYP